MALIMFTSQTRTCQLDTQNILNNARYVQLYFLQLVSNIGVLFVMR